MRLSASNMTQEWTTAEVLEYLASQGRTITDATWYSYVSRGQAPAPARYVGRTPVWRPDEIREFHAAGRRWQRRRQPE